MDDFAPVCVSVKEAARIMGVGKDVMYKLVKQPGFPSVKIGNKYVVRRSGLEEWLRIHQGKEVVLN